MFTLKKMFDKSVLPTGETIKEYTFSDLDGSVIGFSTEKSYFTVFVDPNGVYIVTKAGNITFATPNETVDRITTRGGKVVVVESEISVYVTIESA